VSSAAVAVPVAPRIDGLDLIHRRLSVGMALAGVVAFGTGVGWTAASPLVAGVVMVCALFWRASPRISAQLEQVWLILALVLMTRALYHVAAMGGDVVLPVVDVLLFLMCAESLRSLDAFNDVRLYGLSFALLLAATAYRPGFAFALAFIAYAAMASPALTLGHLRRKLKTHGMRDSGLGRGLIPTGLALSAATLVTGIVVFLIFPRTSQAWAGRGSVAATSMAGFSNVVSIGEFGATIQPNPEVILRVEFPGGRPAETGNLYWRGRSYDQFNGVRWSRSPRVRPSAGAGLWYLTRWPGPLIEQSIYGTAMDSRVLFGLHPMVEVDPDSPIRAMVDAVGDFSYWGSSVPIYTARSQGGQPSPDLLREASGGGTPDRTAYLQLPPGIDRIRALADSLTAGLETRYDKVVRIESWLRSFTYTLELPRSAQDATLEHFLFVRRSGHCEYFSTAMVVMLRALGIESRNVNGFLGGTWSDIGSYLAVTGNEAHSWVEVWFPSFGWVTFDPTPAGSGSARAATSWFWPGRFFMDALQHRWGKWVLDYSLQDQSDALTRLLSGFRGEEEAIESTGEQGRRLPPLVWLALGAVVVMVISLYLLRPGRALPFETRLYLDLVDSARQAGVFRGQIAPLELVERLRAWGGTAVAGPAGSLVGLYVRARFAREGLAQEERAEMGRALRGAQRALARRLPGEPGRA
jgi:transglutaminase-like putative cysteine protease